MMCRRRLAEVIIVPPDRHLDYLVLGYRATPALRKTPTHRSRFGPDRPCLRRGDLAASRGSSTRRGHAALLLLAAALSPSPTVAQRAPQPVFTELFAYDPAEPSQLLRKWRISSQLDSKLQPVRIGVVEDRIGKTVGRVTVQEGDGLDGADKAMLQARHYICYSKGSRAAAVEAEPGGVVPSERAE